MAWNRHARKSPDCKPLIPRIKISFSQIAYHKDLLMARPITPTDQKAEHNLGRIALWLEPSDLEWLSQACNCTDETPEAERERCARIRFRASAALHKAGLRE